MRTLRLHSLRLIPLILLLGTANPAAAAPDVIPGPVPAHIVEVIDGDTLVIRASVWLGQVVETRVRLDGVDTPELRRSKCAEERALAERAKDFTAAWVKVRTVMLTSIKFGKYAGRVVAQIETPGGETLAAALLKAGLARVYDGGKRQPWCPT